MVFDGFLIHKALEFRGLRKNLTKLHTHTSGLNITFSTWVERDKRLVVLSLRTRAEGKQGHVGVGRDSR